MARTRIRAAALELFGQDGYEATTLAAISLRAGYSRALAQYHYPNKAVLGAELLEERIGRDIHVDLLACSAETASADAWAILKRHLDVVIGYYEGLHGEAPHGARLRGEMALHQAAVSSSDPLLKDPVARLTALLIAGVEHILGICRRDGFVRADADPHAVAVLYVHGIWGLALALFANPGGERSIHSAWLQLGRLLDGLRTDNNKGEA
ncbi:MAG: TetR/AcrR family transcriptional regulator [Sphingomonadaceae bacterium]|nr:TetR/AcrR family transcriptional regulator [Sphingomonadaceae bacterium]